jgi:transposase-like protein
MSLVNAGGSLRAVARELGMVSANLDAKVIVARVRDLVATGATSEPAAAKPGGGV